MRSTSASPQTDVVRVRTIRLASSSDNPKVLLNEVFSTKMNLENSSQDSSHESLSCTPNGAYSTSTPKAPITYDTPISRQFRTVDPASSPAANHLKLSKSPSLQAVPQLSSSQPPTPGSDVDGYPWSSAVGRATTGKSGRVIERLMADVDRLQREKHLASVKLEEEAKRSESARSALESLQVANQHLESTHEIDEVALGKRDRKIEELRAELQMERSRREKAETDMKDTRQERDETVEDYQRRIHDETDKAKRSITQYEVLSKSWKSLEEKYERQTRKLKCDLRALKEQMDSDQGKLLRLGVITEQLKQEGEKTRKAKDKAVRDFEIFKEEQEQGIQEMKTRAAKNDAASDEALGQLDTVLGEMKHVINVKKDFRGVGS